MATKKATARRPNGKVTKVWNPPALMVAGNPGQHRLAVVTPNKRRRVRRNPSVNPWELFIAGFLAFAGGFAAELMGGYIANPFMRLAAKGGLAFGLTVGGEHIPGVKGRSGYLGAGAIASAGSDVITMIRTRRANASKLMRPVRLSPGEVAAGVVPDGAVGAAQVIQAAKNGNQAARRMLIEIKPFAEDLSDIVWLPFNPGLGDIAYKRNMEQAA